MPPKKEEVKNTGTVLDRVQAFGKSRAGKNNQLELNNK
jgi:hypothetical protein